MQAAKAKGIRLGNSVNLPEAQQLARQAIIKKADDRAAMVLPIIRQIVAGGENSLHRVADRRHDLVRQGFEPRIGPWARDLGTSDCHCGRGSSGLRLS